MNKKGFITIIIILALLVLGLSIFIVYDKDLLGLKNERKESNSVVEKKEDTNTTKEIDVDSELVKNLIYPKSNSGDLIAPETFVLKDESINSYNFSYKIAAIVDDDVLSYMNNSSVDCYINAAQDFSLTMKEGLSQNSCVKYPENIIKSKFENMFGPDSEYVPQNLDQTGCAYPQFYDSQTSSYYGLTGCGGVYAIIKGITKIYKAELDGDYLKLYEYAMISFAHDAIDGILLFKDYDSFSKYYPTMEVKTGDYVVTSEKEAQAKLENLIANNEAETYVWTFKKQSDGKYYYYSSKWQK